MKELIKISQHRGRNLVNARELHEFLGSKRQFGNWIKERIEKYGFVLNQDYVIAYYDRSGKYLGDSFNKNVKPDSQVNKKDYGLTLDTAKEISMVENNEQGRKARRYFIEAEKQLREQKPLQEPTKEELAQYVLDLSNEKKKLEQEKKQLKPKAEFGDRLTNAKGCFTLSQVAKELDLPFGRNTLVNELKRKGIFFKNKTEPRQEYVNRDYFRVKQVPITRNNHEDFIRLQTLVTQKGLYFLSKIFKSKQKEIELAPIT